MFAYCNNNSINYEDTTGCSLIPSTVYVCDGPTLDMIDDQTTPPYADEDLGSASVAHGGCGPVAAYNAMQLLGRTDISFEEVVDYYQANDGMVMGGIMGTSFDTAVKFFESNGYQTCVLVAGEIAEMAGIEASYGIGILLYSYFSNNLPYYGAHYVAFAQYGNTGCYYNLFLGETEAYRHTGYAIDLLGAKSYEPLKMLLISR